MADTTGQLYPVGVHRGPEKGLPECTVASSNRLRDIGPYSTYIYHAEPAKWGTILPWEFPQYASKADEEAFLRNYFEETEIHMQGGARGEGKGFKFLKQVWYTIAIWNLEHRIPSIANWWWEQEQNRSIAKDPTMLEYICNPDAKPETFFQPAQLELYGTKLLCWVVKVIQANAQARKEVLSNDVSQKQVTSQQSESDALKEKSMCGNSAVMSAKADEGVTPIPDVVQSPPHNERTAVSGEGVIATTEQTLSKSDVIDDPVAHSQGLSSNRDMHDRGPGKLQTVRERRRPASGSSDQIPNLAQAVFEPPVFNRGQNRPAYMAPQFVMGGTGDWPLSHTHGFGAPPLNDRTTNMRVLSRWDPNQPPFDDPHFPAGDAAYRYSSHIMRGGSLRGESRGGRGRGNTNKASFMETQTSTYNGRGRGQRRPSHELNGPQKGYYGSESGRGSEFNEQGWRNGIDSNQAIHQLPGHGRSQDIRRESASFPSRTTEMLTRSKDFYKPMIPGQLPPNIPDPSTGAVAEANRVSPTYIGSARFEVITLIMFSVPNFCDEDAIVGIFIAKGITVAGLRRLQPNSSPDHYAAVFVHFNSHNDARRGLGLDGTQLLGSRIKVEVSREFWDPTHPRFHTRYYGAPFSTNDNENSAPIVSHAPSGRYDGSWKPMPAPFSGRNEAHSLPLGRFNDAHGSSQNNPTAQTYVHPLPARPAFPKAEPHRHDSDTHITTDLVATPGQSDPADSTASGKATPTSKSKSKKGKRKTSGQYGSKGNDQISDVSEVAPIDRSVTKPMSHDGVNTETPHSTQRRDSAGGFSQLDSTDKTIRTGDHDSKPPVTSLGESIKDCGSSDQSQAKDDDVNASAKMQSSQDKSKHTPSGQIEGQSSPVIVHHSILPTILEGQTSSALSSKIDPNVFDDSFHTARDSPRDEMKGKDEETFEGVSKSKPDEERNRSPNGQAKAAQNSCDPGPSQVTTQTSVSKDPDAPHQQQQPSGSATPEPSHESALRSEGVENVQRCSLAPNVATQSTNVATEQALAAKLAEKTKGPSKTESFSMFGRKQEKSKKVQGKSKGSIKGKPKDLANEAVGKESNREISGKATPVTPYSGSAGSTPKGTITDTKAESQTPNTQDRSEAPPKSIDTPKGETASSGKRQGNGFSFFGLLGTSSSQTARQKGKEKGGKKASQMTPVLTPKEELRSVVSEPSPTVQLDQKPTNESNARHVSATRVGTIKKDVEATVGLGITTIAASDAIGACDSDKTRGKSKCTNEDGLQKQTGDTANKQHPQSETQPHDGTLNDILGMQTGTESGKEVDEQSESSKTLSQVTSPTSQTSLSPSKKRAAILAHESSHLIEARPARNMHKRKASRKTSHDATANEKEAQDLQFAPMITVKRPVGKLLQIRAESEGEVEKEESSQRHIVYLLVPTETESSSSASTRRFQEVEEQEEEGKNITEDKPRRFVELNESDTVTGHGEGQVEQVKDPDD